MSLSNKISWSKLQIAFPCRSDTGRSGVFCAVSHGMDQLKNEGLVDIFHFVKGMLSNRPTLLANVTEYCDIFACVCESAKNAVEEQAECNGVASTTETDKEQVKAVEHSNEEAEKVKEANEDIAKEEDSSVEIRVTKPADETVIEILETNV